MSLGVGRGTLGAIPALAAGCVMLAALGGCGGSDKPSKDVKARVGVLSPASPLEQVRTAFESPDADERRQAVEELSDQSWGRQGPYLQAYALLVKTDADPLVRAAAVRALQRAGDPRYLANLIAAGGDASPLVRVEAIKAIKAIAASQAARKTARKTSGETITAAEATATGQNVPDLSAAEALGRLLIDDPEASVRAAAAGALRWMDNAAGRAALVGALRDESPAVRYRARQSLMKITGEDFGYDVQQWAQALGTLSSR